MKNKIFTFALALAAVGAVACTDLSNDNHQVSNAPDDGLCHFTVKVGGVQTRRTMQGHPGENRVNDYQVLVFRNGGGADQGVLDAYYHSTTSSSIEVSCTAGEKVVWAVVNAPSLADVSSLSEFCATSTALSDNVSDNSLNLIMTGCYEDEIDFQTSSIDIDVYRKVAKVMVGRIDMVMTAAHYQSQTMHLNSMYLINVPTVSKLGQAYTPVANDYINRGAFSTTACDRLVKENIDEDFDEGAYCVSTELYSYPNPSEGNDTALSPWTARRTRLVIECTIGGSVYYYPIDLPALESNVCYEITNVRITRPGSVNPSEPVVPGDVFFDLNIMPWEMISLTDGTII